jgi:hypothetical protein
VEDLARAGHKFPLVRHKLTIFSIFKLKNNEKVHFFSDAFGT